MSQHNYQINGGPPITVRADINNALNAIVTQNSGTSFPSVTFPFQYYINSTTGRVWQRNAANTAWIDINAYIEANRSSSQAFSTTTPTTVIFNNEVTDTSNQYEPSTGVMTCSVAGTYLVNVRVGPTANSSAAYLYYLGLFKNGTEVQRLSHQPTVAGDTPLLIGTSYVDLTVGDTLDIRLSTWAGGTLNSFAIVNSLQIRRVG